MSPSFPHFQLSGNTKELSKKTLQKHPILDVDLDRLWKLVASKLRQTVHNFISNPARQTNRPQKLIGRGEETVTDRWLKVGR